MKHRPRIGVIRGGPSMEYDVSINSGSTVLKTLRESFGDVYHAKDIFIDKSGNWHVDGFPMTREHSIQSADILFNALHGTYGEDGKIQSFFEYHDKPFTGSGSLASSIGMSKILSKKVFVDNDIKTPNYVVFDSDRIKTESDIITKELFETFILPGVIKPSSSGSSIGVTVVRSYNEIPKALLEAAKYSDTVMVEEYIPGIETTCAVIEKFRGQELYALPPIEIRPNNQFFDYESKYSGKSEEIVPATFSDKLKFEIEDASRRVHRALGLRHYSRSDFIIHPRRGIYVLEVNTLPGLTHESLLPKALKAVGSSLPEFVRHVIGLSSE